MSLIDAIDERGPLTVAAFIDLALYHPTDGYYAVAAQRSGREGDFFTSVDVGPVFGALIARQLVEMAERVAGTAPPVPEHFDIVEAGAGNGRLSRDILSALRRVAPDLYARTRLFLVEASPAARAAQRATLGDTVDRLVWSEPDIPPAFAGVLVANELLDAFPVHQVVMRDDGLREVYVAVRRSAGRPPELITQEGPLSTPALERYLSDVGVTLEPGWKAEINLQAVDWTRRATASLQRGFLVLVDYGHEALELFSARHATGTLMTFSHHRATGAETAEHDPPAWLARPGQQDITAHVDFTSVRRAAEREGAVALGLLDQTYFLLGLFQPLKEPDGCASATGASDPFDGLLDAGTGPHAAANAIKTRLALKTLVMPGGLGSTLKVLIVAKGVGAPALRGCSYRVRVT